MIHRRDESLVAAPFPPFPSKQPFHLLRLSSPALPPSQDDLDPHSPLHPASPTAPDPFTAQTAQTAQTLECHEGGLVHLPLPPCRDRANPAVLAIELLLDHLRPRTREHVEASTTSTLAAQLPWRFR